jgi:hypothetical protein
MQARGRWRPIAYIAPAALGLAIAAVAACRDSLTAEKTVSAPDDARVTAPANIPATIARARARLHDRNKYDWVGRAHNRAIDDFRAELRKPGIMTGRMCEFLADFVTSPERIPSQRGVVTAKEWQPETRLRLRRELCSKRNAQVDIRPSVFPPTSAIAPGPQSVRAYTLYAKIQNAVDVATSSYDLASRLQIILDEAAVLDETDQAVISIEVSVAQNSFEYWESELPIFAGEVASEYGACVTQRSEAGLSTDAAADACLNDGYDAIANPRPAAPSPMSYARFASVGYLQCPSNHAWLAIVATVRADLDGAGPGVIASMLSASMKVPVVATAIAAGAAGTSIWKALTMSWEIIRCAYGRR